MPTRPTFLVAEPEPQQALSVRKLVLETGKFNVVTAHSTREAIDLFHLFPNITAGILAGESQIDCDKVASIIKSTTDKVPIMIFMAALADVAPIQTTICPVTNLKLFLIWCVHFSATRDRWNHQISQPERLKRREQTVTFGFKDTLTKGQQTSEQRLLAF